MPTKTNSPVRIDPTVSAATMTRASETLCTNSLIILFAKNSLLSSLYIDKIKASLCDSVTGEKPMPRGRSKEDQAMLEMALIGYQHERERIEAKIQQLQAQLKGKP